VAYIQVISVNVPLTVFLFAPVIPYSSEIQQPMQVTAILDSRPHPCQTAPFDREQSRASSLHPEGQGATRAGWPDGRIWPYYITKPLETLRTDETCNRRSSRVSRVRRQRDTFYGMDDHRA
jgi:hypothetical protein